MSAALLTKARMRVIDGEQPELEEAPTTALADAGQNRPTRLTWSSSYTTPPDVTPLM